ncbi:hypothetical protein ACLK15_22435 [Escherichia coli]
MLGVALNECLCRFCKNSSREIVDFNLLLKAADRLAVVTIKKQYAGHAKRVMMGVSSVLTPVYVH